MKKVNLKDIAKKAGVSTTAVSKVLNNLPIRISPDKRKKIKEIARLFNYNPNILARSLRSKKTKTIGIIVPDMSTLFYPQLIKNIETKLSAQGYRCIICNSRDNPLYEKLYIEDLIGRWIDAIVIAPVAGKENLKILRDIYKRGLPILFIDRYFLKENIPYIVSDNKKGAIAGVRFLMKNKVKKIIYLGEEERNQSIDDRLSGIKEEAGKKNISLGPEQIFLCKGERESIKKVCLQIFKNISRDQLRATGIFIESNKLLMGLLDAAKEQNLFIPNDIKIIGFDPFEPEIIYPEDFSSLFVLKGPFSIIQQDVERTGKLTADFLLKSLTGKQKYRLREKVPVRITINGNKYGH